MTLEIQVLTWDVFTIKQEYPVCLLLSLLISFFLFIYRCL